MRGLCAAASNLTKISNVLQEKTASPSAFLEWITEAFRAHSPVDPEAEEKRSVVDIRQKLQKICVLADKSVQELLSSSENYNNRETEESHCCSEHKADLEYGRLLLTATTRDPDEKKHRLKRLSRGQRKGLHSREHPRLQKEQRAY